MKRMLWIAFAVLMLFAGCGSAVNAPNPTERPIAHTTEDPTPIPALEQTHAPTTTASIANEFGCLSIHNIKTGEIISLGDTLEYIVSTIGDPLEYYSNIAFYDSGVFITYERKCVNASDTDIACDFKLFALDGMPCNWELNTGLIAGEYDVQGVINAYGKENGYKLNDELFYMLREDGSTCQAGENDYVVMYGFEGQVITMTLHDSSTDGAKTELQTPKPTQAQTQTASPSSDQTAKPTDDQSSDQTSPTTGMKNALSKAKQYINILSFSHEGMIKQLKYEGYTDDEAKYGADNCGADWMEQAEKKAKEYIDVMAFSYKGIIKQLKYDGFTEEQATHGADLCGADWMEQAKIKAADYLGIMSFSRSGLIDQLTYEEFTQEQAEYGAAENGLS